MVCCFKVLPLNGWRDWWDPGEICVRMVRQGQKSNKGILIARQNIERRWRKCVSVYASACTGRIFTLLTDFTALRFPAAVAPLPADKSARLTADNIRNDRKSLRLFTNHRRCWKCCPSTRGHSYTGGRISDITFEAVLQEYLEFATNIIAVQLLLLLDPCVLIFSDPSKHTGITPALRRTSAFWESSYFVCA
jgi:hypothetical protein